MELWRSVSVAVWGVALAGASPVYAALWDYEGFDYPPGTTVLTGESGGTGWGGPWTSVSGTLRLSDDDVSLISPAFPFAPAGDRITYDGRGVSTGVSMRLLSHPVDMGQDGEVLFVSALVRKTAIGATSAEDIQLQFWSATPVNRFRFFLTSDEKWGVQAASDITAGAATGGSVSPGITYFVVAKLLTSAAGPDQAFLKVFGPGDMVPATEAEVAWDLVDADSNSAAVLDHVRVRFGQNAVGEIDEIRIGDAWEQVAPEPATVLPTAGGLLLLIRRRCRPGAGA